jgi:hypothetical protein
MAIPALVPGVTLQRRPAKRADPHAHQRHRVPPRAEVDVGSALGPDDPPTEKPKRLPADHDGLDEEGERVTVAGSHQPILG